MAVTLFGQNLGRDIVGRAAQRAFSLPIKSDLGCEAEIADFYLHLFIEEDIAQLETSWYEARVNNTKLAYLEIAMNDLSIM